MYIYIYIFLDVDGPDYLCVHWLARPDFLYPCWDSRIQSCKLYPFGNVFSVLKIVTKFCLRGPYIAIEIGGHRSLWCMGLDSLQCPVYWREPWARHVSRVFDLVFARFFLGHVSMYRVSMTPFSTLLILDLQDLSLKNAQKKFSNRMNQIMTHTCG